MVGVQAGSGPGPKPTANQRQMRGLSRGFLTAGALLLALGIGGAMFVRGSLSFALGFIGVFFGAMLLIAAGVVRFAASQPDTEVVPEVAPKAPTPRIASECPKCGGPVGSTESNCQWCNTPLI